MIVHDFKTAFNTYRLKSGFDKLSQLCTALADEGFPYEDSTISRWKQGKRIPKHRSIMLGMLRMFIKHHGITSIDQANELMMAAEMPPLSKEEETEFACSIHYKTPFSVPQKIPQFVERGEFRKTITWHLLEKKRALVYGMPGSGKTALAIHTAHFLRERFSDGILWFRFDVRKIDSTFDDIGKTYGEDVTKIQDMKAKGTYVQKIIARKNALFVFDNVENFKPLEQWFLSSERVAFAVLMTAVHPTLESKHIPKVKIGSFAYQEARKLSCDILGESYVSIKSKQIEQLHKMVGYSPLGTSILLNQVKERPKDVNKFCKLFQEGSMDLSTFRYDDKNLIRSLGLSYKLLSGSQKELFVRLGAFHGVDFDNHAVGFVQGISVKKADAAVQKLMNLSLVERSTDTRFRLHPFVKAFARHLSDPVVYRKLAQYYCVFLEKRPRGDSQYYPIVELELENILGVMDVCSREGWHRELIAIWDYFGMFLWDTGRWSLVEKYGLRVLDSCDAVGDMQARVMCLVREIAWLSFWRGDTEKAYDYMLETIGLAEGLDDDILRATAYHRYGVVLEERKEYDEAEKMLLRALDPLKNAKMHMETADTLISLADVYQGQERFKKAIEFYRKALKYGKKVKEHSAEAIAYYHMAETYLKMEEYTKAKKFFDISFDIDLSRRRAPGIAYGYWGFGRVHKARSHHAEGNKCFRKAIKLFRQLGMKKMVKEVKEEMER